MAFAGPAGAALVTVEELDETLLVGTLVSLGEAGCGVGFCEDVTPEHAIIKRSITIKKITRFMLSVTFFRS